MSNVAIRSLTGIKFGDVSFVTSSTYSISVFSAGASGFHSENTNPASPANTGTAVIVITIIRAVSTRIHFFMSEYLLNYDVCNRRISDLYPFPVRPFFILRSFVRGLSWKEEIRDDPGQKTRCLYHNRTPAVR